MAGEDLAAADTTPAVVGVSTPVADTEVVTDRAAEGKGLVAGLAAPSGQEVLGVTAQGRGSAEP